MSVRLSSVQAVEQFIQGHELVDKVQHENRDWWLIYATKSLQFCYISLSHDKNRAHFAFGIELLSDCWNDPWTAPPRRTCDWEESARKRARKEYPRFAVLLSLYLVEDCAKVVFGYYL